MLCVRECVLCCVCSVLCVRECVVCCALCDGMCVLLFMFCVVWEGVCSMLCMFCVVCEGLCVLLCIVCSVLCVMECVHVCMDVHVQCVLIRGHTRRCSILPLCPEGALAVSEEVVAAVGIPHVSQNWEEIHQVHHHTKSPLTISSEKLHIYCTKREVSASLIGLPPP